MPATTSLDAAASPSVAARVLVMWALVAGVRVSAQTVFEIRGSVVLAALMSRIMSPFGEEVEVCRGQVDDDAKRRCCHHRAREGIPS